MTELSKLGVNGNDPLCSSLVAPWVVRNNDCTLPLTKGISVKLLKWCVPINAKTVKTINGKLIDEK